jgi:alcohol dehydrogenase
MALDRRFEFCLSTRILSGQGLSAQLAEEATRLGARQILLLTDAGVQRAGLLDPLAQALSRVVAVTVFDQTPPGSSPATIQAVVEQVRTMGADVLVALGGGTVLDTAKCARVLAAEGRLAELPIGPFPGGSAPALFAVPTTAGSGAEVTSIAYIYDEALRRRRAVRHPALAPDLALLDPLLTYTLPPLLTAATGMHALSHAVEAFESTRSSMLSDSMAIFAIDAIATYVRDATHNGEDRDARSALQTAAAMAGVAFTNTAPGLVSALADVVSGRYNIHPGPVHGLLLPFVMEFNAVAVPNRYQRIARAMGIHAGGRAEVDVIGDSITEVRGMVADCNLPLRLRDIGIPRDALPGIAREVAGSHTLSATPRPVSADALGALLDEAW